MIKWSEKAIKKWINDAKKGTLIINFEQGFMCNGFSILKIDDELKNIVKNMLITQSISMRCGEFMNLETSPDLKKMWADYFKESTDIQLEKTPLIYKQRNSECLIFIGLEKVHKIDKVYLSVFKSSAEVFLTYFGAAGANSQNKMIFVAHEKEHVACILPVRAQHEDYVITKFRRG